LCDSSKPVHGQDEGIQDYKFKIQNGRVVAAFHDPTCNPQDIPVFWGAGSENGEPAMQLIVPPDLETLINKRLSSGGYTSIEDVLRRALEAQDAEESWTDEERRALSAHIEQGYLQAERGELIDGAQARREIRAMKDDWRLSKR
jgi:Arc/MetJ-type ribon-helix-helix transcriptional regulator